MNILTQLFSTMGFAVLVSVVFGIMLFVSAADFVLTLLHRPTVGEFVNTAVARREWIAVLVALVFGAMIAHFFVYIAHQ